MVTITIDRDMLLDEIYRLRALLTLETDDAARAKVDTLILLVSNAPAAASGWAAPVFLRG